MGNPGRIICRSDRSVFGFRDSILAGVQQKLWPGMRDGGGAGRSAAASEEEATEAVSGGTRGTMDC